MQTTYVDDINSFADTGSDAKLFSGLTWCQKRKKGKKIHWWLLFHKGVKSWNSTAKFRTFSSTVLKAVSSNGWFSRGADQGFLKKRVKTYLMASKAPLDSPTYLRSSHL
jgi:hypothetical protein